MFVIVYKAKQKKFFVQANIGKKFWVGRSELIFFFIHNFYDPKCHENDTKNAELKYSWLKNGLSIQKTISMDRIRWFDKYRPRIVFCKPKTLNAHNFLITWRIRKIQSSPESLFGVHKKYSNHLGSGGQIRTGRVSLNKVFFQA